MKGKSANSVPIRALHIFLTLFGTYKPTREEVRAAILTGKITWRGIKSNDVHGNSKNFGKQSFKQLCEWADLPISATNRIDETKLSTYLKELLRDYQHLAFPEDDPITLAYRKKLIKEGEDFLSILKPS